jgi:hypothetical protein
MSGPDRASPIPPRLLCDEMLQRLGRWLRAAGYDTAIAAGGIPDRDLLELAKAEMRVLITRDRALASRSGVPVVALNETGIDAAAHTLRASIGIDWLHAPFTRCIVDNAPLRPADDEERRGAPSRFVDRPDAVRACPLCRRIYWPGGHEQRMRARLTLWSRG